MRCKVCDTLLDDYELILVSPDNGEHLDLCSYCVAEGDIPVPFLTETEWKMINESNARHRNEQ